MNKNLYNEDSIRSLTPLEFTRLRPGVYCGSTDNSNQLLVEIVSNAIDEFKAGNGKRITITIDDKNCITVEDEGQGFLPNSERDDGKTVLEAAFSVLNTSGKYDEDGVYGGTALGLNGIGSKLCNFLSHNMNVISWRDGKYEQVWFKEGVFQKRDTGKWNDATKPSGTKVSWNPSEEFFADPHIDEAAIKKLLKVLVCLCPGLTITLNDKEFYSSNGLNDLVDGIVKDKAEIITNRFEKHYENGKNKIDIVLTYTDSYQSTFVPYVNTGLTDSGPHITQIKTVITRELNKFFRECGWLKQKDENLSGEDCQEGLCLAFNITAPGVSYDAQTKSRIVKIDMKPFTAMLSEELPKWLKANEKEAKIIVDKALRARKAREAAKRAREAVRQPKAKGLRAKMAISDKFFDSTSKDPKERNLLLVEGKSAATSAVEGRNVKTDSIYLLRGKIISPLKQNLEKILANQEISDIIRVIGAGYGKDFDVNKMNFDKIIITSDADSDGEAIELLLITFFFTYMRPLVEAGKLYRAVIPLYIVTQKDKKYYCYSDKELEEWKKEHSGSCEILRAKGLGEMDAIILKEICFDNQRYRRITISDLEETEKLLEALEGSAVEPRKQFIYNNASTLGFNFT